MEYKKACSICKKEFTTIYKSKEICSFKCKQEKKRETSRFYTRGRRERNRRKRLDKEIKRSNRKLECEICGFSETVDRHHESKKIYILCPNHHALITRGIKAIDELIASKNSP